MKSEAGIFGTVSALAACLALASCATEEDAPAVGRLRVPLVATGSDGAAYRLTSGTTLYLVGGTFADQFSLVGEEAFITLDVPVGQYQATLALDGLHQERWPLERVVGSEPAETVMGTLLTSMPVTLTVSGEGTASLVLSFEVARAGAITFAHGTIDVSVAVDTTSSETGAIELAALFYAYHAWLNPEAPAELGPRLPGPGSGAAITPLEATLAGPWVQRSSSAVCAKLQLGGFEIDGSFGFADIFMESHAGDAEICVQGGGLQITMRREGEPISSTFAGYGQMQFSTRLSIFLPGGFDGRTLDLGALAGSHTAPIAVHTVVRTGQMAWYEAFFSGDATFTFLPTTP